ncbi:MAG: hypothetical protein WC566_11275 [Dehalococcoidia bacterium]
MTDTDTTQRNGSVFVLGAGFTKAFAPAAPLMVDDYGAADLAEKFIKFPHVSRLLDRIRNDYNDRINIEELMTRLSGLMPYDFVEGAANEYGMLLVELKKSFMRKITEAKSRHIEKGLLGEFAQYCVQVRATCVSLNYDDIFDEALFKTWEDGKPSTSCWHPGGGYGFFCRSSFLCVEDIPAFMGQDTAMLLLKLHGSMNWFPRIGYSSPYSIDAFVHHEDWFTEEALTMSLDEGSKIDREIVIRHIEPEPFIVPPVLTKAALVEQPMLRVIWQLAYHALSAAKEVIFVGYSLPVTDISVSTLMVESMGADFIDNNSIKVVNKAESKEDMRAIKDRYRALFGDIPDENFYFGGALKWARRLVSKMKSSPGPAMHLF